MGGVSEQRGLSEQDQCRQKHVADGGAGGVLVFTPETHLARISHRLRELWP